MIDLPFPNLDPLVGQPPPDARIGLVVLIGHDNRPAGPAQPVPHGLGQHKGVGAGRESALRALQSAGFNISNIRDITGVPHNGRPPPEHLMEAGTVGLHYLPTVPTSGSLT